MEHENLPVPSTPGGLPAEAVQMRRFTFAEPDLSDDEGGSGGGGLKRILAAVRYYKWLVLAITVAGAAAGVAASGLVEPVYSSSARLWVAVRDRESDMEGPIQSAELLQGGAWLELLSSNAVLDDVVRDKRLYLEFRARDRDAVAGLATDSVFAPGTYLAVVDGTARYVELRRGEGSPVERVEVGRPIGQSLGLRWSPSAAVLQPGRVIEFRLLHPRAAASRLSDHLDAQMAQGGNFLLLRYTGGHPVHVAEVLNAVAERYVAVAADLKRAKMNELRDILETQLVYAEENLRQAELALESFRVRTITLPSDATPVTPGVEATRAPALASYFDLKIERESLVRDRDAIRRLLQGSDEGTLSVDALAAVTAVQRSPELSQALQELGEKRAELRTLRQQFTDEHPLVKSALRDADHLQRVVVPQMAATVATNLDDQVAAMDALVGSASSELREIPPRAIDEARLTRAVTIAATLYNELRQRYENARLATETAIPDVRILDRASVPQFPSSNPRIQLILLALLGSLGLGIGVAVLLERLDPRIRYPEQVSDGLRLPILGGIPHIRTSRRNGRPDRSEAVEALRSVRLSLTHAYGAAGPMMVTISSPGSGDGKSFISGNLGLSFADLGRRTLIIDGDTRRGTMHRLLGVDRIPGLTDYLAGRAELDQVIRPTRTPGLDVIPCGTRFASAPELLSSPRMGLLLARIRSTYQVVLVDSPPLGAGVDPLVLATATGNLMVVVRTGTTDRAMAEAKLAMVEPLPVRVLGAVVNGLRANGGYRYYKYYSYLPGYASDEEEAGEHVRLLEPA